MKNDVRTRPLSQLAAEEEKDFVEGAGFIEGGKTHGDEGGIQFHWNG